MIFKPIRATGLMIVVLMMIFLDGSSGIAEELLSSGKFVTLGSHATEGTVEIRKNKDGVSVRLNQDFSADKGPALQVLLHREDWPESFDNKDFINLGSLKKQTGTQSYQIPEGINLENFKSVVIWCAKFRVAFGSAHLDK